MKTVKLITKIALLPAVLLMAVGCPSKTVYREAPPKTEDNGGGVDSSGGDALQSTPAEVEAALASIESKTFNALWRATLIYSTTNRYAIDRDYGVGVYDLLESVLSGNKFKIPNALTQISSKKIVFEIEKSKDCMREQHKAGSATGKNGEGQVCLSVPQLQKLSPSALEIESIALAIHEVGHLYFGADENKAQQLQTFFVNNPKFTILNPIFVKQMKDVFITADIGFESLLLALDHKDIQKMCVGLGQMQSTIRTIISIYDMNKGSLPNPHTLYQNLLRSQISVELSLGFCTGEKMPADLIKIGSFDNELPVEKGNWSQLVNNLEGILFPFFTARHLFTLLEDPLNNQPVGGRYNLVMSALDSLSHEDGAKLRRVSEAQLNSFEASRDIYCRDGSLSIANGKLINELNPTIIQPRQVYQGAEGKLSNLALMGQNIMVRTLSNMKGGATLALMMSDLKVGAVTGGIVTQNSEAEKTIILVGGLAAGLNDRIEFMMQDPKSGQYKTAVCRYSPQPLKSSDLTMDQPALSVAMASQLLDTGRTFEEDKTFYRPAQGTLKIYGGESEKGGVNYKRGALVKTTPIKAIAYSVDSLHFYTGEEKVKCRIDADLAKTKSVDLRALAEKFLGPSSAGLTLHCYRNGLSHLPIETFSPATLDFEITP